MRPGDDLAVFYDDAADRGLAEIVCFLRFFERSEHKFLVDRQVIFGLFSGQGLSPSHSSEEKRKKM
jgi:hypothetical protein